MKSCNPAFPETAVGYYLYPRSSTGTKTPLRLSNSVGIIDSGYRGNIIAVFDNWLNRDPREDSICVVERYNRLVQICPPDLTDPMRVTMVEDVEALGLTERGEGGFGSTGR
jgi:dUTP pyrophosphatase